MIHSFDYPPLASDALPAARAYAKIAPSSPHALHMPSHIFTRLGLWQESIDSNLASAEAGRQLVAKRHPGSSAFETLHALDYLEYAYLQIGDESGARARSRGGGGGEDVRPAGAFRRGTRSWQSRRAGRSSGGTGKAPRHLKPSTVVLPWDRFRTLPRSRSSRRPSARRGRAVSTRRGSALGRLAELHASLVKSPPPGPYDWATHVESMRLAAQAWLAYAEGRKDEALATRAVRGRPRREDGQAPGHPGRDPAGARAARRHAPRDGASGRRRSRRTRRRSARPRGASTVFTAGAVRAAAAAGKSDRARTALRRAPRAVRGRFAAARARAGENLPCGKGRGALRCPKATRSTASPGSTRGTSEAAASA